VPAYNGRMNSESHKVIVAKDLEDLIPAFMGNRHKEVDSLQVALAAADFDQLRQLGHRMRGVGNSYGFEKVSVIGERIEDSARSGDRAAIENCIGEYRDYLARVQISYE
jgi:HPt (histidine-containing phosphotransfer) domain-containing protein